MWRERERVALKSNPFAQRLVWGEGEFQMLWASAAGGRRRFHAAAMFFNDGVTCRFRGHP